MFYVLQRLIYFSYQFFLAFLCCQFTFFIVWIFQHFNYFLKFLMCLSVKIHHKHRFSFISFILLVNVCKMYMVFVHFPSINSHCSSPVSGFILIILLSIILIQIPIMLPSKLTVQYSQQSTAPDFFEIQKIPKYHQVGLYTSISDVDAI